MRKYVSCPYLSCWSLNASPTNGFVGVGLDDDLLFLLELVVALVDDIGRVGQKVHDRVEQELNALVLDRRAAHDRRHLQREGGAANGRSEILGGDRLLVEELLGEHVVDVGHLVDDVVASFGGLFGEFGRDRLLPHGLAVVAVEIEGLADDRVDDPLERRLRADRDLELDRVVPELLLEHVGDALVIGARVVHLVDEGDARHAVALHLPVDRDRLALDALARVEHQDRAVEHAKGPLDLDREVDVPWRVDDVDVVRLELLLGAVPDAVRRRGLDRDPLLALEVHRVHLGADAVLAAHLVDFVDAPRVKEDSLGERRLARVDVRRDADVADAFDGDACGHGNVLLFWGGRGAGAREHLGCGGAEDT